MNRMRYENLEGSDIEGITDMPTSRYEAKDNGNTKYYTGKPCHKGHTTYRYTASGLCAACASERAKQQWATGVRQDFKDRPAANKKWNDSEKGRAAKELWRQRDPKRAWAVYATGGAKVRARLKGVPFNLSSRYVFSITPDVCPVFGTPFVFIGNACMQDISASLDRLNPSLGYIEGNVVVISMKANAIKNAYGAQDIARVAEWLEEQGYN